MKLLFAIMIIALLNLTGFLKAQTIEGTCYELIDLKPWSQSQMVADTANENIKTKILSGVKIKLIQDWSRFAEDFKGPDYKEFEIKVDSKGRFKIDLDIVDKTKLLLIEASKDGYLTLMYTLRADKVESGKKVKIILVPLMQKKK